MCFYSLLSLSVPFSITSSFLYFVSSFIYPLILSHYFATAFLHISCNISPLLLSNFIQSYLLSFLSSLNPHPFFQSLMPFHILSSLLLPFHCHYLFFSYHFVPSQYVPLPLLSSDLLLPATYNISSHPLLISKSISMMPRMLLIPMDKMNLIMHYF